MNVLVVKPGIITYQKKIGEYLDALRYAIDTDMNGNAVLLIDPDLQVNLTISMGYRNPADKSTFFRLEEHL